MNKESSVHIAKMISKNIKNEACIAISISNGVIIDESNSTKLHVSLISNNKTMKDGFFIGREATCRGACTIGTPLNECIQNGKYKHTKCSKYVIEELTENFTFPISVKEYNEINSDKNLSNSISSEKVTLLIINNLAEIFAKSDPMNIMSGNPHRDEYLPEAKTILPRILDLHDETDILNVVHEEFTIWFGKDIVPNVNDNCFVDISKNIVTMINELDTYFKF
jgi:hypothetical protein